MAAERKPFIQLAMVDEQNLSVPNDKNGDGKIDFLMNVRHRYSIVNKGPTELQNKVYDGGCCGKIL